MGETIALIVNSVLVALILFYQFIYPKIRRKEKHNRRRNDDRTKVVVNNPNDKPGKAEECMKHMKDLAGIKVEVVNVKREMSKMDSKNDVSHRELFRKIDNLRRT